MQFIHIPKPITNPNRIPNPGGVLISAPFGLVNCLFKNPTII